MSGRNEPPPSATRFVEETARRIASSVSEVLPPDAVGHLVAAQREMLLAIASIIEHNATRTPASPGAKPRTPRKRPARVDLD